jgi:hypothetical protein
VTNYGSTSSNMEEELREYEAAKTQLQFREEISS